MMSYMMSYLHDSSEREERKSDHVCSFGLLAPSDDVTDTSPAEGTAGRAGSPMGERRRVTLSSTMTGMMNSGTLSKALEQSISGSCHEESVQGDGGGGHRWK